MFSFLFVNGNNSTATSALNLALDIKQSPDISNISVKTLLWLKHFCFSFNICKSKFRKFLDERVIRKKFIPQTKAILDLSTAKISPAHISFANNFFP